MEGTFRDRLENTVDPAELEEWDDVDELVEQGNLIEGDFTVTDSKAEKTRSRASDRYFTDIEEVEVDRGRRFGRRRLRTRVFVGGGLMAFAVLAGIGMLLTGVLSGRRTFVIHPGAVAEVAAIRPAAALTIPHGQSEAGAKDEATGRAESELILQRFTQWRERGGGLR